MKMIRNIVIEGPNNVGKSTLISKMLDFEAFQDWKTEHITEKSPNTFEFYDATLRNCENTIFDRHCIGETIYPLLFNREPKIDEKQVEDLVVEYTDTLFIILSADLNFINEAYKNKNEDPNWYFITEEREMFERAARYLSKYHNVHFLKNEHSVENTDDLITFINKLMEEQNK